MASGEPLAPGPFPLFEPRGRGKPPEVQMTPGSIAARGKFEIFTQLGAIGVPLLEATYVMGGGRSPPPPRNR